jgi:hypothetical protein
MERFELLQAVREERDALSRRPPGPWRAFALSCALILSFSLAAAGQDTPATVRAVGDVLKREYIDPNVAVKADAALQKALAEGKYSGNPTPEALASMLNRDLYAVIHDKHVVVEAVGSPSLTAPTTGQPGRPSISRAETVRRSNAGVRRVEILGGNVGYLDLSDFFRPEEARDAIATAMHLLSRADALVIDMRSNGGGSPDTVVFLMSYLLPPSTPLFDIVHRPPEAPDHYETPPAAPADENDKRPIAVLTAAKTFSAGEGFAFLLQERHRAEIVGEVTAGAANPGRSYPVNERFAVNVPNGRIKSAIGGGNWEGAGVTPDVKAAAADALQVAHDRLLRTLGR